MLTIGADSLGDEGFRADHGLRYAYLAGAMYKGISSADLVIAMGRAGMLGYLGAGGMTFDALEVALVRIRERLPGGEAYGMNLLCSLDRPDIEDHTVDMYLHHGVRFVEAAAFIRITPSLVRFRLHGIRRDAHGHAVSPRRILAKVSRPEVASAFMRPPPEEIVRALVAAGRLTAEEAEIGAGIPMSEDICVESDSGGHTDQGVAFALLPAMFALRDAAMKEHGYRRRIRVGAAGGIGTPHAVAAAFIMGAAFVMTGSINQCTVEAGTSDAVKDILQELNVQDTCYAPAGDMFELGARVQVARRGLFFPARANKLYELYQRFGSIEDIDAQTRQQIQDKYFQRSFEAVWEETMAYYARVMPDKIGEIERNPRHKMALIFKWYFVHTTRLAMQGVAEGKVDYQIHCGPALGAFNQWVRDTPLVPWRNRRVADLGVRLMEGAAQLLSQRYAELASMQRASQASESKSLKAVGGLPS
ncbi:PfaD family polyunsaturated fatty acid/polyketide biosynthesis protein [Xanthomonas arboricola]|uniref:PfaD family polyunsaturated fatty acid/polyketide biosynthesis protein n=1 Tax=Xanthomonas arboricola TaxID=56448 RepID=UPI001608ECF2|nr:PfaD family polyunsaturated fatty acid/polyketide biosynthesis protein [Xanthomonas arboricola]MBB5862366.1 trans-AT polyketide synthase/acyltransferase/oxidoreductase domain-containing protein [Xanthomonas arboricola]